MKGKCAGSFRSLVTLNILPVTEFSLREPCLLKYKSLVFEGPRRDVLVSSLLLQIPYNQPLEQGFLRGSSTIFQNTVSGMGTVIVPPRITALIAVSPCGT